MNDSAPEPADHDDELVDEASRESFPASDPPSFSPGVAHGPVGPSNPGESKPPQPASTGGQYQATITRHRLQPSSAISRCCNLQSVAPWGLFLAATVAGIAVGGLLANSYVARR